MTVSPLEGYRIWSSAYDETPNALLALEERVLADRLPPLRGLRFLDAGSGTGRWMQFAHSRGAQVFGVDACHEMILQAEPKPGLAGRSAQAGLAHMPLRSDTADIALCSFTLGYLPSPGPVFRELARIAPHVIVSDLHPDAARAGWTRSFRAANQRYEFIHYPHSPADMEAAARNAGLVLGWRIQAFFDEPERVIFQHAGKEHAFHDARSVAAVLISSWHRHSG